MQKIEKMVQQVAQLLPGSRSISATIQDTAEAACVNGRVHVLSTRRQHDTEAFARGASSGGAAAECCCGCGVVVAGEGGGGEGRCRCALALVAECAAAPNKRAGASKPLGNSVPFDEGKFRKLWSRHALSSFGWPFAAHSFIHRTQSFAMPNLHPAPPRQKI